MGLGAIVEHMSAKWQCRRQKGSHSIRIEMRGLDSVADIVCIE